jgi:hypothetical protein
VVHYSSFQQIYEIFFREQPVNVISNTAHVLSAYVTHAGVTKYALSHTGSEKELILNFIRI